MLDARWKIQNKSKIPNPKRFGNIGICLVVLVLLGFKTVGSIGNI